MSDALSFVDCKDNKNSKNSYFPLENIRRTAISPYFTSKSAFFLRFGSKIRIFAIFAS